MKLSMKLGSKKGDLLDKDRPSPVEEQKIHESLLHNKAIESELHSEKFEEDKEKDKDEGSLPDQLTI